MALFLTGKKGRLLRRNAALQRPFPIILSSSLVIFHMSGVSLHVRGSFNEEWLTSSHCIFFSFFFFLAPWLNYHIQAQTTTKRKKKRKKRLQWVFMRTLKNMKFVAGRWWKVVFFERSECSLVRGRSVEWMRRIQTAVSVPSHLTGNLFSIFD